MRLARRALLGLAACAVLGACAAPGLGPPSTATGPGAPKEARAPVSARFRPYVGEWLGEIRAPATKQPALLVLRAEGGRPSGRLCVSAGGRICVPLRRVRVDEGGLQFSVSARLLASLASPGAAQPETLVEGVLARRGDRLIGRLESPGRGGPARLTLRPRRRGEELAEQLPAPCVCHCSCAIPPPRDAELCPRSECGCRPCPAGIP